MENEKENPPEVPTMADGESVIEANNAGELDDEDGTPVSQETLEKVLTHLGEGLAGVELNEDFVPAEMPNPGPDGVTTETAVAMPNYDAEMKVDASEIAKKLAEATGMPVEVRVHRKQEPGFDSASGVPKPTLESLRERARLVAESFVHCVRDTMPHRRLSREIGAIRAMIEYIHRGTGEGLRKHVMTGGESQRLKMQLTDLELAEIVANGYQNNAGVAVGLGVWIGAQLVRSGLSMEEIEDCACDPIFGVHVLALRTNPLTLNKIALEVLGDVHKAQLEVRAKAGN